MYIFRVALFKFVEVLSVNFALNLNNNCNKFYDFKQNSLFSLKKQIYETTTDSK